MVRLIDLGLGAVALWLAVLLTAGELGGWTHLILFLAFSAWGFAIGMAWRRRSSLRFKPDGAEYGQEESDGRER